jgi:Ca2+-binding RTX toxin-like protein
MKGVTGRLVRRSSLGLLVAAALTALLLTSAAPASAGTLDQQQTSSNTFANLFTNQSLAQTFTAGISGGLDQVDLLLSKSGTPPASVTVEIRNTSAGNPGTAVLATASLPTSAIGTSAGFVPVTFAAPAPVAAGTQYAIVVYSPGTGGDRAEWRYQDGGNPYSPGAFFFTTDPIPPGPGTWIVADGGDNDAAFRTYVLTSVNPTATATCKGEPATIIGTDGPDDIVGTANRDVIASLDGNDKVRGLGGKDRICGGKNKDTLKGGKAKDKLFGQKGRDKLRGGGARDVCKGGKGDDSAAKCEVEKSI